MNAVTLGVIDVVAAVLVLAGLWRAIGAGTMARRFARQGSPDETPDPAGVTSVIRMVGVMLAAFGAVICTFANLIAYYTAHPPT
jgi:hypothetical protein